MKKFISLFIFLCAAIVAQASSITTATITFTNIPAQGNSITVNANTRVWTNVANPPIGFIQTTNTDVGSNATNYYNAVLLVGYAGPITATFVGTNQVTLRGAVDEAVSVTFGTTNYASVSYAIRPVTNQTPVLVPMGGYNAAATRTNAASGVVDGVNTYATNSFVLAVIPHDLATDLFENGTFDSTWLTNVFQTNCISWGQIFIGGFTTNGTYTNCQFYSGIFRNPVTTNLVNYGNAISSPTASGGEAFGAGAAASGTFATAVGNAASATNIATAAVGFNSIAGGSGSTAIGTVCYALYPNSTALGANAIARATNATALGTYAVASSNQSTAIGAYANTLTYSNATALGTTATNSADNQVMLGAPGISTAVQNNLNVATNLTVGGVETNVMIAAPRWKITTNNALANGNNSDIAITGATAVYLSGPSGAYALCGVAGGVEGSKVTLLNGTLQTVTVLNESGVEATPANRIYTGTSGTLTSTNFYGSLELLYSGALQRWIVLRASN